MMINVLHLRDTDRVCGPGKTIIETACAATAGFTHKIGLFLLDREMAAGKTNGYYEAATKRGVEVLPIRSAHQFDPRIVSRILEIIDRHRIRIIHSHEYKSDLLAWAVARCRRIPIMTTVHGWIRTDIKRKLYIRAGQAVLPSFDHVVAVSHQTRDAVLRCGVPAHKVTVIHNGIVTENYRRENHDAGIFRQQFGVPNDASLVGCVGRLSREKGQADLLEAASRLLRDRTRLWIALVGDGPDLVSLRRQAHVLGLANRVIFTGHVQDVRPILRDLDVLALTSHTEGLPNVVLEAFCMETPVIANDVGGVGEIVADGVTGLLLPRGSPERIAQGVARLLDHPTWAKELAHNARRRVHETFSFRNRVAKEETLCRQILDQRHD